MSDLRPATREHQPGSDTEVRPVILGNIEAAPEGVTVIRASDVELPGFRETFDPKHEEWGDFLIRQRELARHTALVALDMEEPEEKNWEAAEARYDGINKGNIPVALTPEAVATATAQREGLFLRFVGNIGIESLGDGWLGFYAVTPDREGVISIGPKALVQQHMADTHYTDPSALDHRTDRLSAPRIEDPYADGRQAADVVYVDREMLQPFAWLRHALVYDYPDLFRGSSGFPAIES